MDNKIMLDCARCGSYIETSLQSLCGGYENSCKCGGFIYQQSLTRALAGKLNEIIQELKT